VALRYLNLDDRSRKHMLEEIEADIHADKLYYSSYFSEKGKADWPVLLKSAVQKGTDDSLASEIRSHGRLNETTQRKKPSGGFTTAKVPNTAHETLSEGQFNRYYMRAVCRRALEDKIPHVIVYRAKETEHHRAESDAMEGKQFDPASVLADLRENVGTDKSSGFPGPNSGMSIKLP
jgi:hypothetical protein